MRNLGIYKLFKLCFGQEISTDCCENFIRSRTNGLKLPAVFFMHVGNVDWFLRTSDSFVQLQITFLVLFEQSALFFDFGFIKIFENKMIVFEGVNEFLVIKAMLVGFICIVEPSDIRVIKE